MKAVIQRVKKASVLIDGEIYSEIGQGVLILLGIEESDDDSDINWLANKIVNLRIFDDEQGIMNHSVIDIGGELLVVSQFTLHASTKKGNRPSYIKAAKPGISVPTYQKFIKATEVLLNKKINTGSFGSIMDVSLINDGPVTIIIDTKNKE